LEKFHCLGIKQPRPVTDSGTRTEVGCLEQHAPFTLRQVHMFHSLSRTWKIFKLFLKI